MKLGAEAVLSKQYEEEEMCIVKSTEPKIIDLQKNIDGWFNNALNNLIEQFDENFRKNNLVLKDIAYVVLKIIQIKNFGQGTYITTNTKRIVE